VITRPVSGGLGTATQQVVVGEEAATSGTGLFPETQAEITPFKAVEDLLVADVTVYESHRFWKYGYFKVEIKRRGPEALPVIPKDVVLVQDSSASMTEQRLYFCRDGLVRALDHVGPDDRFNVISFKDGASWCFHEWAANNPANRKKARAFIEKLQASGETDIFTSAKSLLEVSRDDKRPVVVILVTDGRPTTGLTDSTDIIGQFSKLNDGDLAVFTMGTVQTANEYLLDLLGYCNGGGSFVVDRGRWDIPDSLARIASETSRPVMHDVAFRFADGCECEVFPALTGNLYLDRGLVLYGRYPKGLEKLVFQAVGKGRDVGCDMIFDVDLESASRTKDRELRDDWARQKVYHLIGEHARTGNPAVLSELRSTARAYGMRIPYRGEL
jgi:Ca-activated chloride channel family protein